METTITPFDIVRYKIQGRKIIEDLLQSFLSKTATPDSVERIELFSYGDFSGIPLDYPSGIYLKGGIAVSVGGADLDKVVEENHSQIFPHHEVIYYKPEPDEVGESDENIPLDKCFVGVAAIKSGIIISNVDEAYDLLRSLIDYLGTHEESYTPFPFYALFSERAYGRKLIDQILNEKKFTYVEHLIFDNLSKGHLSWTIAQLFIKNLTTGVTEEQKLIVQRLIDAPEPLSDYWKEKVAEYL